MTATSSATAGRSLTRSSISRARRTRNVVATTLVFAALAFAVLPLGLVLYYVASKGLGVIGQGFLTGELPAQVRSARGGIGPAIAGTLVITGFATLLAVPLGILAAVYLHETAPLLFTIGASRQYNWSLSGPSTALSAQIFANAQTGYPAAIDRAWGAALTLILLVLLLSTVARIVAARFTVR